MTISENRRYAAALSLVDDRTRRSVASDLYMLLWASRVTNDLHYDDDVTVTVKDIRCVVTANEVEIVFPDLHSDPETDVLVVVKLTPAYLFTSVATVVEGLLTVLYQAEGGQQ
ncbi:MAG TPA: hypothetical protein VFC19_36395 [Candidatus Limnocylindrales bacterium]|nr:hypothetical protein [Candidatus Limnocylindrales bacterium]